MKKQEWITLISGLLCAAAFLGYLKFKNVDWSKTVSAETPIVKGAIESIKAVKPDFKIIKPPTPPLSEQVILTGCVLQINKEGMLVTAFGLLKEQIADYDKRPPHHPITEGNGGVFFLTGHPDQNKMIDSAYYEVDAVEDGIYEYTTTFGAVKHVKRYRVVKNYPTGPARNYYR